MSNLLIAGLAIIMALCPSLCHAADDTPNPDTDTSETPLGNLGDLFDDDSDVSRGELLRQFLIAVLFVLLLGTCAWWVSRKLMPRMAAMRGKSVVVAETIHLGSRRTLHVLEVAPDRRILIGSTGENISFLAELDTPGQSITSHIEPEKER